jgi:GNAT superfamily N-acetyltransferase
MAVNAITHPDFRGKGIFIVLHDELNKFASRTGIEFTLGYANINSYKGCLRHLDYKELGRFPLWVLPLNLPKIMAAQKSKQGIFWRIAARAAGPFFHLERAAFRPRGRKSCLIEKTPEFGAEFDEFWETAKEGHANILIRNRDFLNWRFVAHPTRRYDIFTARSEGRLLAYLVGTISSIEGLRWGVIVDMLADGTDDGKRAAKHLVASFTRYARAQGADLAAALMFKHAVEARALRRNGYIKSPRRFLPRDFPVLIRWNMLSPAPATLYNLSSWYMTLGDYDAV